MDSHNIFGILNTVFIFISLIGVCSQLRTIWQRKENSNGRQRSTELLSLNQFFVSFLAYFSFFVYGYSIEPFNHYIVWPRLFASTVVATILYEIYLDRQSKVSFYCLLIVAVSFVSGLTGLVYANTYHDESRIIASSLIILITLLIAQGYYHQIMLIIHSQHTGAVDLRMSQFILMMDVSTIAFAISMGIKTGWPLLFLAIVSGITKLTIMYLFRWVRLLNQSNNK